MKKIRFRKEKKKLLTVFTILIQLTASTLFNLHSTHCARAEHWDKKKKNQQPVLYSIVNLFIFFVFKSI